GARRGGPPVGPAQPRRTDGDVRLRPERLTEYGPAQGGAPAARRPPSRDGVGSGARAGEGRGRLLQPRADPSRDRAGGRAAARGRHQRRGRRRVGGGAHRAAPGEQAPTRRPRRRTLMAYETEAAPEQETTRKKAAAPRKRAPSGSAKERASSSSGTRTRKTTSGARPNAVKIARAAREQLSELLGRQGESVIGVQRTDDGWEADIEVVETARIPDTTDVLA